MPIYEFVCVTCKETIERYTQGHIEKLPPICALCGIEMEHKEFSVPAKRDPEKGIQR